MTGEVIDIPMAKSPWLKKIPVREAKVRIWSEPPTKECLGEGPIDSKDNGDAEHHEV